VRDQVASPAVDVVFFDHLLQALHSGGLLLEFHLQREANGLGQLLGVVRVHDQGVPQLAGRSRELAQDQHALLVVAGGHKLLGYKGHSVVERGHHAEVDGAVQQVDFLMAVVPLEQHDGLPLAFFEAPVDALGLGIDFGQQIAVTLDVGAPSRTHIKHYSDLVAEGESDDEAINGSIELHDSERKGLVKGNYRHLV